MEVDDKFIEVQLNTHDTQEGVRCGSCGQYSPCDSLLLARALQTAWRFIDFWKTEAGMMGDAKVKAEAERDQVRRDFHRADRATVAALIERDAAQKEVLVLREALEKAHYEHAKHWKPCNLLPEYCEFNAALAVTDAAATAYAARLVREAVQKYQRVLERERSAACHWIEQARDEIRKRSALTEGRQSYEWDDDDYRKEFAWALIAIAKILDLAEKDTGARDLIDCPTDESEETRLWIEGGASDAG